MNNRIFENYEIFKDGKIKSNLTGKVLKPSKIWNGYLIVKIYIDKKFKSMLVHRLVALRHIGDIEGMQINHKNGIKTDNNVENLEIVTQSQNMRHLIDVLGFKHPGYKKRVKIKRIEDGIVASGFNEAVSLFKESKAIIERHCRGFNSNALKTPVINKRYEYDK